MSKDRFSEIGPNAWALGVSGSTRAGLTVGSHAPSLSRTVIECLQRKLGGLLSSGVQETSRSFQHPLGESSFRFLLANEVKRSQRSGHSFHILLTYFAEAGGWPTPIDDRVTSTLIPILSGVLRETDYIGWYRDSQVLGGVLTALRGHSADEVSSRIEQRLLRRMGREFQAREFARLRVRFFPALEFGRLESTNSLFEISNFEYRRWMSRVVDESEGSMGATE